MGEVMDEIDRKLLSLLSDNARMSVSALANALSIARTTTQARMERLERSGAITGYTIRRGQSQTSAQIVATVLVQLDPRAAPNVLSRLQNMPSVRSCHTSSGRFDLILRVVCTSTKMLDDLLDDIGIMTGVRSSESLIELSSKFDRGV
jgi:DNA-binding Lrp family transcriptional regulator